MRRCVRQFLRLAAAAALELTRQPLILLITASAVALTGLLPLFACFMFGEEVRLVRDGALAIQLLLGFWLAGSAAAVALRHELTRGTAAAALSKPVGRSVYFLAKYAGVLLLLAMFVFFNLLAALLSVRLPLPGLAIDWRVAIPFYAAIPLALALAGAANLAARRPFVSRSFLYLAPCLAAAFAAGGVLDPAGGFCRFGALLDWRLAPAVALLGLALAVLAAAALSLSTRLPPVFTLAGCGALLFLGLLADYLLRPAAAWPAACLGRWLPNWQDFWLADALAAGGQIPWSYVGDAAQYALLLIAGFLCFGLGSFQRVEIN